MRKVLTASVAVVGVVLAASAYAAPVNKVTSKATANHTGSKAKPAAFAAKFTFRASDSDGLRPLPPTFWTWAWNGVQTNGSHFPKCTGDQIDAAQSDSVCPKGSLVGKMAIKALVGPESDRASAGVGCNGKSVLIYANGPAKATFYVVGPADQCAGVGYLPPFEATLATKSGTTKWSFRWPDNITHALPGIAGSLTAADASFDVVKAKDGTSFMTSSSCSGGTRKFAFSVSDATGTASVPANAGACKK